MNDQVPVSLERRGFLRLVGGGVVLLPVAGLVACSGDKAPPAGSAAPAPAQPAPAAEPAAPVAEAAPTGGSAPLVQLEESDPVAVALGYRHDASQVDAAKFPRYAAGQNCANCIQFRGGAGEQWGGCGLFPGRSVNAAGWCNGYAPKA